MGKSEKGMGTSEKGIGKSDRIKLKERQVTRVSNIREEKLGIYL